jgi:hypothetical protein
VTSPAQEAITMPGTPDPRDTDRRRIVVAASCLVAPATLLAAFLVGPSMAYLDPATTLREAASQRGGSVVQAILLLVSSAFFVPVLVGAMNLLRGRGRTLGALGAVAFLAGICGHLMLVAARMVLVQMAAPGSDAGAMEGLARRLDHGVFAVITPLEMCFDVGLVLLFIALRRAAAVPTWLLAVIIGVAVAAGVLGSDKTAFVIAGTGGLVAGPYLGARIGRADSDAWERGRLTTVPSTATGSALPVAVR